jgi:hypothetical protein
VVIFPGDSLTMSKPRISYVDPSMVDDSAMIAELERCARGSRRVEDGCAKINSKPARQAAE